MSAQPVDITIFGRLLRVNCPPEQLEALALSAEELEQRLRDLKIKTGVNNTEQLVFITALNICHELSQERQKNQLSIRNLEERVQSLLKTMELALIEQSNDNAHQDILFE